MSNDAPTPTVSFSLTFKDAAAALDVYKRAFGAEELFRMPMPGGGTAHAEFRLGNTRIFMSDESEEWGAFAMPEGTTASCLFSIETDDCDASHAKALREGAESISEPEDQFWGCRSSVIRDPFGYRWSFAQITEQLSPEEVMKRANELFGA